MLVLIHDSMGGNIPAAPFPPDVEITTDRARLTEADAVIFHIPDWRQDQMIARSEWDWRFPFEKRPGQRWIGWSMECDEHYPWSRNIRFMRHFDLTMTYRLTSDAPVTYVIPNVMVEAFRRPPVPKHEPVLAASFVSSRYDHSGRQAYLQELARHMAIDSYGSFMRNRTLSDDRGIPSKLAAIAHYRFTIAFENACSRDYVTEKFFEPLQAGSVPVYLGAPNIEDFAPGENCFINAANFPDPGKLAAYLKELASDEEAYSAYFAWRQEPFRQSFKKLLDLEFEPWLHRMCRALRTLR